MPDNLLQKFAKKTFGRNKKSTDEVQYHKSSEEHKRENYRKNYWGTPVTSIGDIASVAHPFMPKGTDNPPEHGTIVYIQDPNETNAHVAGTHTVTADRKTTTPQQHLFDIQQGIDAHTAGRGGYMEVHNHPERPLANFSGWYDPETGKAVKSDMGRHEQMQGGDMPYLGAMVFNEDGSSYSFVPSEKTPKRWMAGMDQWYDDGKNEYRHEKSAARYPRYTNVPTLIDPRRFNPAESSVRYPPRPMNDPRIVHRAMAPKSILDGSDHYGGKSTGKYPPVNNPIPKPARIPGTGAGVSFPKAPGIFKQGYSAAGSKKVATSFPKLK